VPEVRVDNQHFNDMTIWAARPGSQRYLPGDVFTVQQHLAASTAVIEQP
jgi:hypothetical protein